MEDTLERLKKGDVKAKVRRSGLSKTAESGKRVHFEIANMDSSKSGKPIEVSQIPGKIALFRRPVAKLLSIIMKMIVLSVF